MKPKSGFAATFARLLDTKEGRPIRAAMVKAATLEKSSTPSDRQLAATVNENCRKDLINLAEHKGEPDLAAYLRRTTLAFQVTD